MSLMDQLKKTDHVKPTTGFDKRLKKSIGLFDALTDTDSILLLDTSGSMDEQVEGKRLIDHLKLAVEEYIGEYEMVEFNDRARAVTDVSHLQAQGMTALLRGLELCKQMGASHVMLVSDGHPNCGHEEESIQYCIRNKIKVSSMFIGNSGAGLEFKNKISNETGGVHTGNVVIAGEITAEGFGHRLIK